jgi:hypothetical protein
MNKLLKMYAGEKKTFKKLRIKKTRCDIILKKLRIITLLLKTVESL